MTWKAEKNIFKSRQVYYEHGDKAGRLLALQLKQQSTEQMIPGINTGADSISCSPRVINDQFKQYYSTLYQSELKVAHLRFTRFLILWIPQGFLQMLSHL